MKKGIQYFIKNDCGFLEIKKKSFSFTSYHLQLAIVASFWLQLAIVASY